MSGNDATSRTPRNITTLAKAVPSSRRGTAPIHSDLPAAAAGDARQCASVNGAASNAARCCDSPTTWFTPAITPASTRRVNAASPAWRASEGTQSESAR